MARQRSRLLNFTIDIKELKDYDQRLIAAIPLLHNFEERFLTTLANKAMRKAMKRTPVDTGRLRRSYKITKVEERGGSLQITLYNDAKDNGMDESYASYVEFGHFTRGRVSWVEGHWMLTLATDEVKSEMNRVWNAMMRQWAKEAGI